MNSTKNVPENSVIDRRNRHGRPRSPLLPHAYEQDLRQQTAAGFIVIAAVQAVQERIAHANLRPTVVGDVSSF
ncbi:hypothetical protein M407DRAFT_246934 [Tulasnella calospora MUT 4182]|uniref:Uncharacterized protein n=1 Tax=Tulasnella calospora MUT 4182 TaxID=1051891 RepID=A0A0C3Q2N8_9AGAM|nr:hypothetical protein M407DRAFT_246934 [Tulasnella calospora MUT 4182]